MATYRVYWLSQNGEALVFRALCEIGATCIKRLTPGCAEFCADPKLVKKLRELNGIAVVEVRPEMLAGLSLHRHV